MRLKPVVLFIDDDARIAMAVGDRLRFDGYEVVAVHNADDGLRHVSRHHVDLVLLDVNMPGMNGFTFLSVMATRVARPIPVVVFTARADLHDIHLRYPGVAVVSKTQSSDVLLAEIRRALAASASRAIPMEAGMKRIVDKLKDGKVMISDGGWGTILQQKGLKPGECPELWCVEHSDAVRDVARQYVDAGAEMVKTNSFGASCFKLLHFGLQDRVAELNHAAARLSREAAGPDRHVIASMGPTGKMLLMGDVSEDELYASFRDQAKALEAGGADACLIETFAALDEGALAVKAARENTGLEVLCTFTFERTVHGQYRTMMGVAPGEMALAMVEAGAHIVGTNCGNGMDRMVDIVRDIRAAVPGVPVIVHANAGAPVHVDGRDVFPQTPAIMAEYALQVRAAGADILGGCCGTTPAHIRAMAAALWSA
jgi:5-methyltetrahydrofolate--homocysteine methyltransferase